MATRFLDDAARAAFARAVETVEGASAVEVVVAVRQRSARYLHANMAVATVAAIAALAYALFAERAFSLLTILVDPVVLGAACCGLVELTPGVKRALTPAGHRRAAVARAAKATFVDRGVHATTGRSGLLVYVSWLEREVALVADLGLLRDVPTGALAAAEAKLTAAVPRGGAAVAAALAGLAPMMAKAMPHQADDVNELPDAVDTGGEVAP
jgi:putative membrane protein